jgi:DNA polymerase III subunit epsilon
MREIVVDTETTGLDPATGHRLVEIGCVEVFNFIATGKTFHTYLNPERDMPEEARQIHGLSGDFLADKPLFSAKAQEFIDFIGDAPLIIHNAGFDMKFLNAELGKCGFQVIPFERAVDTVTMARRKFPGSPVNLDALCRRFGVDNSSRDYHGALLDAQLLSEVYLELRGGRQPDLAMEVVQTVQTVTTTTNITLQRRPRPAREHTPTAEEIEAHRTMLADIKEAIWLKDVG